MAASSAGEPMRFRGWRSAAPCRLAALFSRLDDKGVSVSDGATALSRIPGASSAARARVSPSTAPLALAIEA